MPELQKAKEDEAQQATAKREQQVKWRECVNDMNEAAECADEMASSVMHQMRKNQLVDDAMAGSRSAAVQNASGVATKPGEASSPQSALNSAR